MSKLILVRGVPGSGKSTYVKKTRGIFDCHREADEYFIRPDGVYDFNSHLLKEAHEWCFNLAKDDLLNSEWVETVYVSNTFTRLWEMQKYIELAKEEGIELEVVRCTGNYQNVHGVPSDKVQQMKERFEDYKGEIYV